MRHCFKKCPRVLFQPVRFLFKGYVIVIIYLKRLLLFNYFIRNKNIMFFSFSEHVIWQQFITPRVIALIIKILRTRTCQHVCFCFLWSFRASIQQSTCSSLMAIQQSEGNPFSMGIRKFRHPFQWATRPIVHTMLIIRTANDVPDSECCKQKNIKTMLLTSCLVLDIYL